MHTRAHAHTGLVISHKKKEIPPFATTGADCEGIMLSEVSQRKTNILLSHLPVESEN